MGLTIHYSGRLRNPESISALIHEVTDIAESMHWPYELLDSQPGIPVRGILVAPEGSEPLWLTFHQEGFLCNPVLLEFIQQTDGQELPEEAEHWVCTKTQYAGVEAHMAMIRLLRYLSQQYFEHFELHDESRFWETNDEAVCRKRFANYDRIMGMVGEALGEMTFDPDESRESVMARVEKVLTERFGLKRKE